MDLLNKGLGQFGIPSPDKHAGHDKMVRWGNSARYWAKAVNDGFVFGDWVEGISESIFSEVDKQYSKEEWAKRKVEIDKARKEAELEHLRLYEETSIKAVNLWDSLEKQVPEDHPYLVRKQIRAFNAKYSSKSNSIVIPLKDGEDKLWSLQFINSTGEKRFMSNGRTKGCYYFIGQPNGRVIICEGYATGISIFEATKDAVVVAFNKGNLEEVTKIIQAKYPAIELIIAADNDIREDGSNVGINEANRVASIYECSVVIPALQSGEKCDFNDVAVN